MIGGTSAEPRSRRPKRSVSSNEDLGDSDTRLRHYIAIERIRMWMTERNGLHLRPSSPESHPQRDIVQNVRTTRESAVLDGAAVRGLPNARSGSTTKEGDVR